MERRGRVPGGVGADTASFTFERELGTGLEEGAEHTLAQIDHALARLDDGTYGVCERCGGGDRPRAPASRARRRRSASTTSGWPTVAESRARAAPQPDVRVGSATNGLAPVSVARALARAPDRGSGRASPPSSRRPSPATSSRSTSSRATSRSTSRRTSSGRSRSTASRTRGSRSGSSPRRPAVVIALTGLAVLWMLVYFARSRRPASA